MKFYFNNLLDAATLTGTGSRTGFPLTNTQHPHLSVRWRSIDLTAQYILVDAGVGETLDADMVAILAHNLSATATVTFKANDTDAWGAPSLSMALDPTEELILEEFADCAYRFGRFDITDAANPDGFVEIGRLWIGATLSILPAMIVDFTVVVVNDDAVTWGVTRQKYADVGDSWRKFEFSFPPSEEALIAQLKTMYELVGKNQSLIVAPVDITTMSLLRPCYVGITQDLAFRHHSRTRWTWDLVLEEDK
jgi:hypothetical protein